MADSRDIIVSVNVIREPRGTVVQTQLIRNEPPYVKAGIVTSIVGKDGSLIYTGSGVPLNTLGVFTDIYIDNVAPNNYYQKDVTNVWVLKGSLQGASGDDGREVLIQNNGTHIQWQYEGDVDWTDIVEVATLKGDTGANIELQKSATHIQWRVVGDTTWINLVALADLKGDKGDKGDEGTGAYEIYVAGGGTLSEAEYNASITNIPTHISDATKHIDNTTDFTDTIDETNDKFTIWDNSLLKWIRFSFANLKSFMKTYFDGIYEPLKGTNDNYVTDAQLVVLDNTSGTNTGDQDLSGYELLSNKKTNLTDNSDVFYPTQKAVNTAVSLYNITNRIPLPAGSYYTLATAIAAIPTNIRKLGLKITFQVSATNNETWEFFSGTIGNITNVAYWRKTANSTDLVQLADEMIAKSRGKNIYNPKNTVEGYYINSIGAHVVAIAGVKIISIYGDDSPIVINYNTPVAYMYIGFYDKRGNLISTVNARTNPLTLPEGTDRTDISVYPNAPANLQVEIGEVSTAFEKYTEFKDILPDIVLPDDIVTNSKILDKTIDKVKLAFSNNLFVSGDEDLNIGLSDKIGNSYNFFSYGIRYFPTSTIVVNALKIDNIIDECIVRIWSDSSNVYTELYSRKLLTSEIETGYFLFPEMTFTANKYYAVSIERLYDDIPINCSTSGAAKNPTHVERFLVKITSANAFGVLSAKVSAFSLVHLNNLEQDVRLTLTAKEIIDFEAAVRLAVANKNEIAVPSQLYAYTGLRNDFNVSQLIKYHNRPDNYLRISGAGLKQYGEKAVITPTVDISATFELNDENCEVVESVVTAVKVAQSSDMTTHAVVCNIGDSLTEANYWIEKTKDLITTNVTFAGILQRTLFPEIFHEGRSGWKLADYFMMKKSATTVYSPFMHPTAGTGIFQGVVEYNAYMISTTGTMKIALDRIGFGVSGYPTTPTTDSIVYSIANARYEKWNGTAWVDAVMTDGDFSFSFSKYVRAWDIETEFGVVNVLYIMLGTNDFWALNPDDVEVNFAAYKTKLDTVIISAKSYNANIKIGIGLENIYVGRDANNDNAFASKKHLALFESRKLKLITYDNRIAENIYCVDWGIGLDRDFGFTHTTIEAYPYCESTSLIEIDHNTPHPKAGDYAGYYPLAHIYAGWIAYLFSSS